MKRNILLIYITGSLSWGRFFIPVLALFYIASQVPLEQFAVIMAVFALSTLLLEIPSGVVADLLGKKKTLILSRLLYIVEIAIIAFYNGFLPFLIAKIISGIGVSLSSGTVQSLLYDSLKRQNKEKEYKKTAGHLFMITNVSMAVIFIIGGVLFSIHPKLPAYASLPFIITAFILTFFLKEPYAPSKALTIKNSWLHLKEGLKEFWKSKALRYIGFYSLPIAAVISIMLSLSSAYFEEIAIPVALIGIFSFLISILTAFVAKKADGLEKKWGEKTTLRIIQLTVGVSLFLMAWLIPYIGVLFILLLPFASGLFDVIIPHYVNTRIPSSHRATMLSVKNFFDNIGIVILFPTIGFLTRSFGMGMALFCFALFFLLYLLILKPFEQITQQA